MKLQVTISSLDLCTGKVTGTRQSLVGACGTDDVPKVGVCANVSIASTLYVKFKRLPAGGVAGMDFRALNGIPLRLVYDATLLPGFVWKWDGTAGNLPSCKQLYPGGAVQVDAGGNGCLGAPYTVFHDLVVSMGCNADGSTPFAGVGAGGIHVLSFNPFTQFITGFFLPDLVFPNPPSGSLTIQTNNPFTARSLGGNFDVYVADTVAGLPV